MANELEQLRLEAEQLKNQIRVSWNFSVFHGTSTDVVSLCVGYIYDSTSIRRQFDCLSKVIRVTVT